MSKIAVGKEFLKHVWQLTKSYWQSEEKTKAYSLLIAIIALSLGSVYMLVELNKWNNAFYTALQNYQKDVIFDELIHFTWIAFIYIIFVVYSYYLQQILVINWRKWLTTQYIDEWLKHKTYYRMQMFGTGTDNPDQRISEDVKMFVTMTLSFAIGILKAFCTLVSFVVILWGLSGPLEFSLGGSKIHIEGYLVWVAVIYAVIGTGITHLVGKKLVDLNYIQQKFEANFRFSMMRMRENAESVAFYAGEHQEGKVFKNRFVLLLDNFWKIIQKQKQLVWINSIYSQIAIIFPFVVTIPRYLSKEITLGGLMQVATAFGKVQDSLSYFVETYANIAEWQAVVDRLTEFRIHMNEVKDEKPQGDLVRKNIEDNLIELKQVEIDLPNGNPILKDCNYTFKPGINILIKGASGSGKSTLLRALAGIWPFVHGEIDIPSPEKTMFIPQKPYLPLGTLRDSVLYPGTQTKTDEELKQLMEDCYIGYLVPALNEEAEWSHVLSVGEQQRLAFVRALIYAPQWLFLDEATSALDETTEAGVYKLVKERLKDTTLVSVGHRSTLNGFHDASLFLDKEKKTMEGC